MTNYCFCEMFYFEAATRYVLQKRCSYKFRKIHRKTPDPDWARGLQLSQISWIFLQIRKNLSPRNFSVKINSCETYQSH